MNDLIKMLKSILGDNGVTEEMAKSIGQIAEEPAKVFGNALKTLVKYKETFTEDLDEAVTAMVKAAFVPVPAPEGDEIDLAKIGAKFAKATAEQIKQLKAIVDKLYADLGTKEEESTKSAHEVELEAQLKKYKDAEEAADLKKKKEDEDAAIEKKVKDLVDVELAKRARGTKKSADGQETEPVLKGGPDNFPSFKILGERE